MKDKSYLIFTQELAIRAKDISAHLYESRELNLRKFRS